MECTARGTEADEEEDEGEMSDNEATDILPIDDWIAAL